MEMELDKDKEKRTLVAVDDTPEWMRQTPQAEEGASVTPVSGSKLPAQEQNAEVVGDEESDGDATGVENVRMPKGDVRAPEHWSEAVQDHFYPKQSFNSNRDVIDFLERQRAAIHIPTKEELEKERRRRRTEGIMSSIADGASAISNLITTTQYAPDMYSHESSLTGKMRERYDKLKAQRQADADRYLNYSLMIDKMKKEDEDRQMQKGRDALQRQLQLNKDMREQQEARLKQAKADRDALLGDLDRQLKQGKLSEQEHKTREAEIKANYEAQLLDAELKYRKSGTARNYAQANKANNTVGNGKTVHHFDGKGYYSDKDYTAAMETERGKDTESNDKRHGHGK